MRSPFARQYAALRCYCVVSEYASGPRFDKGAWYLCRKGSGAHASKDVSLAFLAQTSQRQGGKADAQQRGWIEVGARTKLPIIFRSPPALCGSKLGLFALEYVTFICFAAVNSMITSHSSTSTYYVLEIPHHVQDMTALSRVETLSYAHCHSFNTDYSKTAIASSRYAQNLSVFCTCRNHSAGS